MSQPPQPGQWGPGNPPPPGPPQGYHPPPPGPPQQPGYYPQPGWGPPPPKQSNGLKWLLIAVAVLLVIAITVGVTLFFTRGSGGGSTTPTASDIASANDTGPVAVITFEPTCEAWTPIGVTMSQVQANGWGDRDPSVPASQWTAQQRSHYDAVAKNMRQAADQAMNFARQTPNRVIRELYEQFIAYSRAYADSIPTYSAIDDYFAIASIAASVALDSVCSSIKYGSAVARSTSVPPIAPSAASTTANDPADPQRMVSAPNSNCTDFLDRRKRFLTDTAEWVKQDASIPSPQWSADQKAAADTVAPVMTTYAADVEAIGKRSDNATFQDIALFVAIYFHTYADALPSYTPADNYLVVTASRAANLLGAACQSAGG